MASFEIIPLQLGPMLNYAYVVADTATRLCAVIDPGWDPERILEVLRERNLTVEAILLTHAHFDHAAAVRDMNNATGARVYVHETEALELELESEPMSTHDGMVISIGNTTLTCLHTPGHTPGSQCFLGEGALFTGDTLFVDGCGRVDLPGGDARQMLASLARLAALDSKLMVYPGHDYGGARATLGELCKTNPYLSASSPEMLL